MRVALLILAVTLLFVGCSSSYTVGSKQTTSGGKFRSFDQFNEAMAGSSSTVVLMSGREFRAREIQARKDSTSFVDEEELRQVSTRDIRYVQRTDRWGGALEGLMFGTFGPGLVAYTYGSVIADGGDQRELGIALLTISGAAIGGVAGIVLGVIKGHRYTFEFVLEPEITSAGESDQNPVQVRVLESNH